MSGLIEQIGKDRHIVSIPGKKVKQSTSRWKRRRYKQDPEVVLPKYKGWYA